MKDWMLRGAGSLLAALLVAPAALAQDEGGPGDAAPTSEGVPGEMEPAPPGSMRQPAALEDALFMWPDEPERAVRELIERYGPPDDFTPGRVIWYGNGPWARTVVHRDPVLHRFPLPHIDYIEQAVSYEVPADHCDELLEYDGSLVVDLARGELVSCCDGEASNVLALNLAHGILTGELDVAEARRKHADVVRRVFAGEEPELVRELAFGAPAGELGARVKDAGEGVQAKAGQPDLEAEAGMERREVEVEASSDPLDAPPGFRIGPTAAELLGQWPEEASAAAWDLIARHGEPDEVGQTVLVWHERGPWKRTIVHREPACVEQVIAYPIISSRADELAAFDPRLLVRRTAGELAACGEHEQTNLLTLNLAALLMHGLEDVESAQERYADALERSAAGEKPALMEGFQLLLPGSDCAEPGEAILDEGAGGESK